jgi:hypothetical protein
VDTRDAAVRWAEVWANGWPAKDVEGIVGLQAEDGVHWASMFRPYHGRAGLRIYVQECFDEETRPPGVRKLAGAGEGWRIRVGDYRVLYEIRDAKLLVTVVKPARRRVYRGR